MGNVPLWKKPLKLWTLERERGFLVQKHRPESELFTSRQYILQQQTSLQCSDQNYSLRSKIKNQYLVLTCPTFK